MGSLIKPLKTKTVQRTVYETVREAILTNELKPGDPISIQDIAQGLNVSAMPVREALRQLEALGLVRFASPRKIVISKLSVEDLKEFYWIRISLEVRCLELNFTYLRENRLPDLRELHVEMCKEEVTHVEWIPLNREFHMVLYGTENSKVLKEAMNWLWNSVAPYLYLYAQDRGVLIRANEGHEDIIEGIAKGDIASAKDSLRRHLETGLPVVSHYLE